MSQNQLPTPPWSGWSTTALLGRGGFGAVYQIERDNFGSVERAAMKVITIPQNESEIQEMYSEGYTVQSVSERYSEHMKSIVHEYSLMAALKGCASVVYCDDVYQRQHVDGVGWDIFIRMELLTPLMQTLHGEYREAAAIRLGIDIARALTVCKKQKIIHRDIKPQNIFVSADGTCKLGDFGIAKITERTTSGTKTGTYKYMAPEVYHDEPYGMAVDVYSLGMVLYWLMNERRGPFMPLPPQVPTHAQEEQAKVRRFSGEALPPPKNGSEALKALVLSMCANDPAQRPDAETVLRQLGSLAYAVPAGAEPAQQPELPLSVPEDDGTVGAFAAQPASGRTGSAPAPQPAAAPSGAADEDTAAAERIPEPMAPPPAAARTQTAEPTVAAASEVRARPEKAPEPTRLVYPPEKYEGAIPLYTPDALSAMTLPQLNALFSEVLRSFLISFFLGMFGVHKFRQKKVGQGLLYLFTLGLFTLGWFLDNFFALAQLVLISKAKSAKINSNG